MPVDDSFVRHAAITYLQCVLVEDLVKFTASFEVLADQFQEELADVCCKVCVEWWVEPYYLSSPVLSSLVAVWVWCVFQLVCVSL